MPTLTREELHELVWTEPVREVAKRYGVSDVAFRKYCIAGDVPMPPRGHWAQLAAGKAVVMAPLPARAPGANEDVLLGRRTYDWNPDPEARLAEPLPAEPTFAEPLEDVRNRVIARIRKAPAKRPISGYHPGLRRLLTSEARRAVKYARYKSDWYAPLFKTPFEDRRLKFINNLAFGLSYAGGRLEVRGETGRDITVTVGDTHIGVRLDRQNAKPNRHGQWETFVGPATTALRLTIAPREDGSTAYPAFMDDDDGKLEAKLKAIVIEIIVAGEAEYRRGASSGYAWALKERERLEAEVARRRAEALEKARLKMLAEEKARRDQLFGQAQAWRTAQDIRGFVAAVQSSSGQQDAASVDQWARWALAEAEALDPVTSGGLQLPALAVAS